MSESKRRGRLEPRPAKATFKATFFVTCLVDQFRPQVGEAVVEVLEAEGVSVDVPREQTCCGQPAFNSGYRRETREVASRFMDVFDGDSGTPIVTPSGSCAAMVRNYYPILFRDDPAELERAKQVGERLWEFSEFLVDGLGISTLVAGVTDKQVSRDDSAKTGDSTPTTYHRCCHALRELGIDSQPESILQLVPDLRLTPLNRSEVCCGFGGAFSVKMADISTAMLKEKLDNVEATGAAQLVAGDTGCLMHMEGGLRRRGSNVQVLHIAELLAGSGKRNAEQAEPADPAEPAEPAEPAAEESPSTPAATAETPAHREPAP